MRKNDALTRLKRLQEIAAGLEETTEGTGTGTGSDSSRETVPDFRCCNEGTACNNVAVSVYLFMYLNIGGKGRKPLICR